jgi:hypothetical protein
LAKARAFRVILVSELGEVETGAMGMEKAADLDAALALAREGRPQRCVIIPDGGTVVPMIIAP